MRKVIILFLVLFFLISGYLYFFFGGKEYVKVLRYIYDIEDPNQSAAVINDFYGDARIEGGIYAGTVTGVYPGVFVWGKRGLSFYKINEFTVFSVFKGCTDEILNREISGTKKSLEREVLFSVDVFENSVYLGGHVSLLKASREDGASYGYLNELWYTDWWPFLLGGMKEKCGK